MTEDINQLRNIILDTDLGISQRIDAAEIALRHDVPESVTDIAIKFLRLVSTDAEPVHFRLKALDILMKRTTPKASATTEATGFAEKLEAARLAVAEQRKSRD